MKKHDAIKFDMTKRVYLPLSRAHEVALRTYEPPTTSGLDYMFRK